MAQQTPNLSLPFIQGAQAQKHVTHNEALEVLDTLVQLAVERSDLSAPPAAPGEGQAFIVGPAPTGDWAGQAGRVASFRGGGWVFLAPRPGWLAWDRDAGDIRVWRGGSWQALPGGGPAAPDLDNLDGVGINAASDAVNRLSVSAPATLLNHDGAGHQLKVNKAGSTDTASLLFQSGFSGRAEMGLAGHDDFTLKTSPDGAAFTEALRVDAASGITRAVGVTGGVWDLGANAVLDVVPPAICGFVLVTVLRAANAAQPMGHHGGIFIYDVGASPATLIMQAGTGMDHLGAQALTPASGTAGKSGIAASEGKLQIVNRTTETLSYNLTFLGGVAGR